jgi:hypothetical protein
VPGAHPRKASDPVILKALAMIRGPRTACPHGTRDRLTNAARSVTALGLRHRSPVDLSLKGFTDTFSQLAVRPSHLFLFRHTSRGADAGTRPRQVSRSRFAHTRSRICHRACVKVVRPCPVMGRILRVCLLTALSRPYDCASAAGKDMRTWSRPFLLRRAL